MSETNKTGCAVQFVGGFRDGERAASAALMAAGFPSGQALAWTGSGWAKASANDYVAIAMMGLDDVNIQSPLIEGTQQAGQTPNLPVAIGTNMILMEGSKVNGTLSYPFLQTPTGGGGSWTVGDKIYLTAANLWNNTFILATDQAYGEVVEIVGNATSATALRVLIRQ